MTTQGTSGSTTSSRSSVRSRAGAVVVTPVWSQTAAGSTRLGASGGSRPEGAEIAVAGGHAGTVQVLQQRDRGLAGRLQHLLRLRGGERRAGPEPLAEPRTRRREAGGADEPP